MTRVAPNMTSVASLLDGLVAGDNLQSPAELGALPSRAWTDAALQALPWSVRARLQRDLAAGATSVPVDSELLHATLRYVPNAELRRQVSGFDLPGASNLKRQAIAGSAECRSLTRLTSVTHRYDASDSFSLRH